MFSEDENYIYYDDVKIAIKTGDQVNGIIAYDSNECSVLLLHDENLSLQYLIKVKFRDYVLTLISKSEFNMFPRYNPNYYDRILELSMMLRKQHDAVKFIDKSTIPYKKWDFGYGMISLGCDDIPSLEIDESHPTLLHLSGAKSWYIDDMILKERVSRYMSAFTFIRPSNVKRAIN